MFAVALDFFAICGIVAVFFYVFFLTMLIYSLLLPFYGELNISVALQHCTVQWNMPVVLFIVQSQICLVSSVLEEREDGLVELARTVRALVDAAASPKQSAV